MNLSPLPIQKFFDSAGRPLNGGLLFTYVAGTTTKIATYTSSTGLSANTNPIVLDYRGEANIWLDPARAYKFVLSPPNDTDPPTNPIWTVDNITSPGNLPYSGVDTGVANNIILSIPGLATLIAFTVIYFKAAATNTGATTITLNGVGKNLTWQNIAALGPGEIQANGIYEAVYDGTQWQLQGPALQSTQMRSPAETTAGVTPTNFAYLPIYAQRYGYSADNLLSSASANVTALNNAIAVAAAAVSGATGATVILPTGIAYINATITLPNRVRIVGQNCSGTIIKAHGTFSVPTVPFMFYALNGTIAMFDSILQDLFIDASDVAGLGCIKSIAWQENSGLRGVGLLGFRTYGLLYEQAWGGASTLEIQQSQFFASNLGANACVFMNLLPVSGAGALLLHIRDSVLTSNIQGTILSVNTLVGGALYTAGTYTNVALTGGTGTQAHATIVVAGGVVTSVTITAFGSFPGGINYVVADTLSALAADIGGTGAGFSIKVATIAVAAAQAVNIGGSSLLLENSHIEGCLDGVLADTSGGINLTSVTGIAGMTNLVHLASTFTGQVSMICCRRNGAGVNFIKNDVTGEIITSPDPSQYFYPDVRALNTAKAWCVFNGTTAGTNPPTAGFNVTSVQRTGAGAYRIFLGNNANSVNMTPMFSSNLANATYTTTLINANSFSVVVAVATTGVATDSGEVKMIAFGP